MLSSVGDCPNYVKSKGNKGAHWVTPATKDAIVIEMIPLSFLGPSREAMMRPLA